MVAVLLLLYADRFGLNIVVAVIIKTIFSLSSFAWILLFTCYDFVHFSTFSNLIRRYFCADFYDIDGIAWPWLILLFESHFQTDPFMYYYLFIYLFFSLSFRCFIWRTDKFLLYCKCVFVVYCYLNIQTDNNEQKNI